MLSSNKLIYYMTMLFLIANFLILPICVWGYDLQASISFGRPILHDYITFEYNSFNKSVCIMTIKTREMNFRAPEKK